MASFVDPPDPLPLGNRDKRRDAGGFPVSAVPNSVSSVWRTQTPVLEDASVVFRTAEELGIDISRNERGTDEDDRERAARRERAY